MQTISKIRSAIFYLLSTLVTLGIGCFFLPLFWIQKINIAGANLWAKTLLVLLSKICKINLKILGRENIPKTPFIIACKHQSTLETLALYLLFSKPIFIIKRELLFIPIVGMYLKNVCSIIVNRSKGRKAILHIQKQLRKLSNDSVLIIFPEGTRTKPGTRVEKYNSGVAMIYETLEWPIVPVALNTGVFWPKHGPMYSGTTTIKILPAMLPSKKYDRKQFLKQLNEIIENESIELYKTTLYSSYGGN